MHSTLSTSQFIRLLHPLTPSHRVLPQTLWLSLTMLMSSSLLSRRDPGRFPQNWRVLPGGDHFSPSASLTGPDLFIRSDPLLGGMPRDLFVGRDGAGGTRRASQEAGVTNVPPTASLTSSRAASLPMMKPQLRILSIHSRDVNLGFNTLDTLNTSDIQVDRNRARHVPGAGALYS